MKRESHYQQLGAAAVSPHVVTIGNFDGVHLGHRALLRSAREKSDEMGIGLAVLTFEPHPAEVLKPGTERLRLVSPGRKAELLAECGVDLALFQLFDAAFASLDAEAFARDVLARALGARVVYVGANFRFGRGREAGVADLERFGRALGFEVLSRALVQSGFGAVSSSRIRAALAEGNVARAAGMLGRFHEVTGIVTRDRQLGSKMGFPTVNLKEVAVMLPKSGIYAALCEAGEQTMGAAAYIGDRPTTGAGFSIEAHLLDFSGALYEAEVTLRFVERIRGDRRFEDTERLVRQIEADVAAIRAVLKGAE